MACPRARSSKEANVLTLVPIGSPLALRITTIFLEKDLFRWIRMTDKQLFTSLESAYERFFNRFSSKTKNAISKRGNKQLTDDLCEIYELFLSSNAI